MSEVKQLSDENAALKAVIRVLLGGSKIEWTEAHQNQLDNAAKLLTEKKTAQALEAYQALIRDVEPLIKDKTNDDFADFGTFFWKLGQAYAKCAMLTDDSHPGDHYSATDKAYVCFKRSYDDPKMRSKLFVALYFLKEDAKCDRGLWFCVSSMFDRCTAYFDPAKDYRELSGYV